MKGLLYIFIAAFTNVGAFQVNIGNNVRQRAVRFKIQTVVVTNIENGVVTEWNVIAQPYLVSGSFVEMAVVKNGVIRKRQAVVRHIKIPDHIERFQFFFRKAVFSFGPEFKI